MIGPKADLASQNAVCCGGKIAGPSFMDGRAGKRIQDGYGNLRGVLEGWPRMTQFAFVQTKCDARTLASREHRLRTGDKRNCLLIGAMPAVVLCSASQVVHVDCLAFTVDTHAVLECIAAKVEELEQDGASMGVEDMPLDPKRRTTRRES